LPVIPGAHAKFGGLAIAPGEKRKEVKLLLLFLMPYVIKYDHTVEIFSIFGEV